MANKKGDLGVLALAKELVKREICVCFPFSDGNRFDLVCGNKELKKVQIKEMYKDKNGSHVLSNYSTTSRGTKKYIKKVYSKNQIDFLVGYVAETDDFYIIPIEEIKQRYELRIWHTSKPKIKNSQRNWERFLNKFDLLA